MLLREDSSGASHHRLPISQAFQSVRWLLLIGTKAKRGTLLWKAVSVFSALQGCMDQALKKKILVICPNNVVNILLARSNIWL